MTREVKICMPGQPIREVAQTMAAIDVRVRRLPVVNREKRLVEIFRWGTWPAWRRNPMSSQKSSLKSPRRETRIARSPSASLILALLVGCSHVTVEQEFDQAKSSWLGATYDEMVTRWGPPTRSATLSDGRQTHTWTSQEGPVRAGGPSVGVGVFGGGGGGGGVGVGFGIPFGMTQNPPFCERTVTFLDGKLAEQNWTGDPAYCSYFKRG